MERDYCGLDRLVLAIYASIDPSVTEISPIAHIVIVGGGWRHRTGLSIDMNFGFRIVISQCLPSSRCRDTRSQTPSFSDQSSMHQAQAWPP